MLRHNKGDTGDVGNYRPITLHLLLKLDLYELVEQVELQKIQHYGSPTYNTNSVIKS